MCHTTQPERKNSAEHGYKRDAGTLEVQSLLAGLDPEHRALLMLTAGLGYSFDETALIMDMKRGTVASKVGRAKEALRAKGDRR